MRKPILHLIKRLVTAESGNATVFVALGLPAMIGAAGYAVDMSQLYMWKRELQHSVDQAALAGAWALAYDDETDSYTTRAQQEFDANQGITTEFATSPSISLANYDGGIENSVIVSATVSKRLPFSGFLIDKPLFVRATAQATFAAGGSYKACLMALKKNAAGAFDIGGTATVNAKCGLGALSCDPGAIEIGYKTKVTTDSIATCGTANVPSDLESVLHENIDGLTNPFATLPPPELEPAEEADPKSFKCPKKNTLYLAPGRYVGGMDVKCKVVFSSGIYVVDGGTLDFTSNQGHVTGTKVLFVLRNGATLKLGGSGNGGYVNLSPMEAGDFTGTVNDAYKDKYAGMLFYEEDDGESASTSHIINGNSDTLFRGIFYLPKGDVTINGGADMSTSQDLCFQLWSSTLKITGTANIKTTCASENTLSAGSSTGGVRLVA